MSYIQTDPKLKDSYRPSKPSTPVVPEPPTAKQCECHAKGRFIPTCPYAKQKEIDNYLITKQAQEQLLAEQKDMV